MKIPEKWENPKIILTPGDFGTMMLKQNAIIDCLTALTERIAKLEAAISPKTHAEPEKSCDMCFHPQNNRTTHICGNEDCDDDYSGWISEAHEEPTINLRDFKDVAESQKKRGEKSCETCGTACGGPDEEVCDMSRDRWTPKPSCPTCPQDPEERTESLAYKGCAGDEKVEAPRWEQGLCATCQVSRMVDFCHAGHPMPQFECLDYKAKPAMPELKEGEAWLRVKLYPDGDTIAIKYGGGYIGSINGTRTVRLADLWDGKGDGK